MKPSEIEVGATYVNRGAGRSKRKVIAVGPDCKPAQWLGFYEAAPNEDGVIFEQNGFVRRLYISSFAKWAGKRA